jgi:hypothetical protein
VGQRASGTGTAGLFFASAMDVQRVTSCR